MTWLINTRLGQALILTAVILLCWWGFSAHYEKVGYDKCQSEHNTKVGEANIKQIEKQNERDSTSSAVATDTSAKAEAAVEKTDTQTNDRKETIRDEYKKPPAVVVSACTGVAPVPGRVQNDFDAAVRGANAASRGVPTASH
jgi:hypothetical protein